MSLETIIPSGLTGPKDNRHALASLGAAGSKSSLGGAAIASYLLYEPGFVKAPMALGERDAYARKDELLAFFELKRR